MEKSQESFTFTVGKLDAGMAILLGERAHLIEFPSVLLPPGTTAGSIVNIAVHQNHAEEKRRDTEFWSLQKDILEEFGVAAPEPPKLQLRNVTQTSVTLEWPTVKLASAKLRSLDIYRNGQRLAAIPSPMTNTSTKLSGLDINTEYSFQLVLRTTAGTFPSNIIKVHTHTMEDTSGISVCFGNVQDETLLDTAKMALREMKAKWSDRIQIDTTHFVCTTPAATPNGAQASGNVGGAPGVEYQRALQLSIPVVTPYWILACHSERRMMAIAPYYLGAEPPAGSSTHSFRPQSMSQASLSRASPSPSNGNPQAVRSPTSPSNRASMPAPARHSSTSPPAVHSPFVNQPSSPTPETIPEEPSNRSPNGSSTNLNADETEEIGLERSDSKTRKRRSGTMNKEFKFPSAASSPVVPQTDTVPPVPPVRVDKVTEEAQTSARVITPSSIEVPPPPPVEKEKSASSSLDDGEDDVGDTVEIEL
ncbi:hypothetical protein K435DRAFT_728390 [Dendrothele bispora CBS 962.96]|uniref:Fibronectin type III/BRCA1 domain-containing protein n=1 Tax=Dendrothele bispora (strain CBS 962.96) TaxID=1314807 RepID=A0A4S8LM76_DENBC|nr:hypothetical protein K435DRAFT_728390 [Dendrothele bispora CBS 962.96]